MIYQCQKCGLSKSDSAMGSVLPQCKCDWNAPPLQPAPVQEPVACGYDETTGNCTNNPCCYTTPPEPPAPVQEPVSDTEIAAWAERHDIQGTPTDLRGMFEDAASFTTPPAAQPAVPDAITDNSESPEYRTGWNDCRTEMLKGQP